MPITYLHIKNMCCDRCIEIIRVLFLGMGYRPVSVSIGQVIIDQNLSPENLHEIKEKLQGRGFDIAENSKEKIVVRIHAVLCAYLGELNNEENGSKKISTYLAEAMHRSYYHLSRIFTATTGITIEKYFIQLKMEKAKELIIQDELSMAEIANSLGYSSQQIFSTQFKKETGKTPGEYKANPVPKRIHLDQLLQQHFKQNA